jgi:hypothetical protein
MNTRNDFFNSQEQDLWNTNRLAKLTKILGEEWFKDKTVLEVGCGHGKNGKYLQDVLGAKVTFTDGREMFVDYLKQEGYDAYVMDNNQPWIFDKDRQFDLIIHWGLSYHLENWKQDLENALQHSKLICFETEIADFPDDDAYEKVIEEREHYDQSLNHKGTLISSKHLEKFLKGIGANIIIRYDDVSINASIHHYDWIDGAVLKNLPEIGFISGQRRFYMIKK